MTKRVLKFAGIGFLIGVAVCSFITALSADPYPASLKLIDSAGSLRNALLLQYVLSGVYGSLCMCGSLLYDLDRLPLAAATFLHCLLVVVPFYPLALLLGWYEKITDILIMNGFQLAAFFGIWLILYFSYRKKIRELNEMQKQLLEKNVPEDNVK